MLIPARDATEIFRAASARGGEKLRRAAPAPLALSSALQARVYLELERERDLKRRPGENTNNPILSIKSLLSFFDGRAARLRDKRTAQRTDVSRVHIWEPT